jgi:hypothetical protein
MSSNDYLVVCDASGFVCKKSETRMQWNGMLVRKDLWEPRHPQDFIKSKVDSSRPKEVRLDNVSDAFDDLNMYYDRYLCYDSILSYEIPSIFDETMII